MVRGYDYPVVTIIKNDDTVYFSGRTSFIRQSSTNDGGWNQILCYQGTAFGASNPVQQVIHCGSGSYNSIFVLTTNGDVWAYGANGYGTLGLGVSNNDVFWYQSINLFPHWTGQTSDAWSNKVRIDPVSAMACCGEGQETTVLFLTRRGKIKACGYGGNYANGEHYSQHLFIPHRLHLF
jgi:alpha-tubulin suppressor-like RCC1 family protein